MLPPCAPHSCCTCQKPLWFILVSWVWTPSSESMFKLLWVLGDKIRYSSPYCPLRKRETLYNPIPCAISCSFSSTQEQSPSGISPNKPLLWYFWWSLALWYYLASDCHNTFPFRAVTFAYRNLSPPNFTICILQLSLQRSHTSFGEVFPSEM